MRSCKIELKSLLLAATLMVLLLPLSSANIVAHNRLSQDQSSRGSLTPLQFEITKQRERLSSADVEERREAVVRLGSMHHPEASRAALAGLRDAMAIVRATAVGAIWSLPPEESATNLVPLLADKDEFVRRETAYALGKTKSRTGVSALIERLLTDKSDGVRGAAAVALGEIADVEAVTSLNYVINPQSALAESKKKRKSKKEANPFVLRAAVRALGQIGSPASVPALIQALKNEKAADDVRREAAVALGLIGDPSSIPALREALTASDPYLSQAAHDALRRISKSTRPS